MKTIKTSFLIIAVVSVIIIACKRENGFFENSSTTGSNNLTKLNQPVSVCRNENVDRHFISIQYAFDLINNYQAAAREPGKLCELFSEGGWVFSETFPQEAIRRVLDQQGCCKFRIYNGLDKDNRLHLVMTGVNEFGSDILYCTKNGGSRDSCNNINNLNLIVEMGAPCPEACTGALVGP